jgi:SAM-dependent methyltransferase/uncharacterized protein YbaR (Trm112 family)
VRHEHLERLRPVCPGCRDEAAAHPLRLGSVAREADGAVLEGVLECTNPLCRREHPVIDGIPVVVADLAGWAAHQLDAVLRRDDLSPLLQTLLGDAAGPGSAYERDRIHLSGYVHAHFAPDGGFGAVVDAALGLLEAPPSGLWIDAGCAAGGASFALARAGAELVVGVDLAFGVLRAAETARRERRVRYPLRRLGLVYDEQEAVVDDFPAGRVAFWCCDVGALPFGPGSAAGVLSLNVLDCVPSPLAHLAELGRVLGPGAPALVTTPYDWSIAATQPAAWIGGHSQRGGQGGSGAGELRRILGGGAGIDLGLRVAAERDDVLWRVRSHERATVEYRLDTLRLERV